MILDYEVLKENKNDFLIYFNDGKNTKLNIPNDTNIEEWIIDSNVSSWQQEKNKQLNGKIGLYKKYRDENIKNLVITPLMVTVPVVGLMFVLKNYNPVIIGATILSDAALITSCGFSIEKEKKIIENLELIKNKLGVIKTAVLKKDKNYFKEKTVINTGEKVNVIDNDELIHDLETSCINYWERLKKDELKNINTIDSKKRSKRLEKFYAPIVTNMESEGIAMKKINGR